MPLTGARISCSTLAPKVSGESIRWYVPGIGEPSASVAYRPDGVNRTATQTLMLTIARDVTAMGKANFRVPGWGWVLAPSLCSDMIASGASNAFRITNHSPNELQLPREPALSYGRCRHVLVAPPRRIDAQFEREGPPRVDVGETGGACQ